MTEDWWEIYRRWCAGVSAWVSATPAAHCL